MNIRRVDLNLLVYLDVLLREKSVTRSAEQLGITQPAMSNGLKRLRDLFDDPLLIRTSTGMTPTERAQALQPQIRQVLEDLRGIVQPDITFDAKHSKKVFRIMCSDYAEATLLPAMIVQLRELAPNVILDLLTPSDVSSKDMEQGKVDIAINRFNEMPAPFYEKIIWTDSFSCLINAANPLVQNWNLENYLKAHHIWVSKTGMGIGFGVNPEKSGGLGWIDQALGRMGKKRQITIFTRHYSMPALLAMNNDLVATLPSRVAIMQSDNKHLVLKDPPFDIPEFELKMAWSPLLNNNPAHKWLRQLTLDVGLKISSTLEAESS
ncbi:MAG: LysR family transcriptional regulator [Pseudomonadales bacterium]|nr:LysR family transcriptional regulator [Pseudomonadales bacterium]